MVTKIAINGFGRIGKCILRALAASKRTDIEVVVINVGFGDLQQHAHLFKYDSTHGIMPDVKLVGNNLNYSITSIPMIAETDPKKIDWTDYGVDIVFECTGIFASKDKAMVHIESGAKKVMVSAPCTDADATIVYQVNHEVLKAEHEVISVGSCTTNCLAPIAKVLDNTIGIEKGFMTTIHAYTNDQSVLDSIHKDPRRARACATSMIPASTGAAKALSLVLPQLTGKLDGTAIRVPTPNVSLVDLVFTAEKNTSVAEINNIVGEAVKGDIGKVLGVCDEPLVSVDFNHNPKSSIFDLTQTKVVNDNLVRVVSWYDNEWGFSNRMLDVAALYGAM